jgi:hypothetical protein
MIKNNTVISLRIIRILLCVCVGHIPLFLTFDIVKLTGIE